VCRSRGTLLDDEQCDLVHELKERERRGERGNHIPVGFEEEAVKSGGGVARWWCFSPLAAPRSLDRVRDRSVGRPTAPVNLVERAIDPTSSL
jgi:hypothetical protein